MKLELVGGPLDGSFVDESELPPEGIRTTFYAARATAPQMPIACTGSRPSPLLRLSSSTTAGAWSTLSDDTYPTD